MENVFTDYTNHVNETFDPSLFLGRLTWYSIPETTEIEHNEFCKVILQSGVGGLDDDVVLPNAPRTVDVFKRACKAAERPRIPHEGGYVNFLIRDAGNDSLRVYKELVVEQLDSEEHVLSYNPIGKFTYIRSEETVNLNLAEITDSFIREQAYNIVEDIKDYYAQKKYTLIAYPVREFIRRTIEKNYKSILARPSGGVYFVLPDFEQNITALETVVNSLPGCQMITFPVVNDGKMREAIRVAFEDESCSQADRMLGEMAQIISSNKKISVDKFTSFKTEYEVLRDKVVSYSDVLDQALEHTASRLELMQEALFDIVEHVKV